MISAMLVCASMLFANPAVEEFVIDDFYFSWTVDEVDDCELRITKDEESTDLTISDDKHHVRLSAEDAVLLGAALKRTDEFYKKIGKSKEEARIPLKVSENVTVYFAAKDATFFAVICEGGDIDDFTDEEMKSHTAWLTRKAVNRFVPHLLKAGKMVEFVDEMIKP